MDGDGEGVKRKTVDEGVAVADDELGEDDVLQGEMLQPRPVNVREREPHVLRCFGHVAKESVFRIEEVEESPRHRSSREGLVLVVSHDELVQTKRRPRWDSPIREGTSHWPSSW